MSDMAAAKPSPEFLAEYSGNYLLGTAIAFIVLDIFFVALRFLARYMAKVRFGLDDAFILAGLVLCLAMNAIAIAMVKYAATGYHLLAVLNMDPTKAVLYAKLLVAETIIYLPCVSFPRLAMLLVYLKIFTSKPYRIACYVVGAVVILQAIIESFLAGFECIPLEFIWDKTIPGGRCFDTRAFWAWGSFPNILIDLAMIILPMQTVWNLQIARTLKIGLTLTFVLGGSGMATSIIRFVFFVQTDPSPDATWTSVYLMCWTIVECGVYLIAACIPTYRPLVLYLWRKAEKTVLRSRKTRNSIITDNKPYMSAQSERSGINKTITVAISGKRVSPDSDEYMELVEPRSYKPQRTDRHYSD